MNQSLRYYVDVVVVLAKKDFKLRYKNSVLGFIWSLLNPLANMLILTLVFAFLLRSTVPNYASFLLIGLLVWRFFQLSTSQSLTSIVANPSLVTKVYMPRYLIVLSNNLANLLAASIEIVALIPLLVILGVNLTIYALFLPLIILMEFGLIFGLSLSLSALNLLYRDLHEVWEIAIQLGFFVSPIIYDPRLIPARFQFAYSLNPVTRIIDSARDIFLYAQLPTTSDMQVILGSIVVFLAIGFLIFSSLERRFSEEL